MKDLFRNWRRWVNWKKLKRLRLFSQHTEESFRALITNKNILKSTNQFLNSCDIEISPRMLLFALFIYWYPSNVDENEYCVALSRSVYNCIGKFLNLEIPKLKNYLVLFERSVKHFCSQDKIKTVEDSRNYYEQLCHSIDALENFGSNTQELEEMYKLRNKIVTQIKKIYGEELTPPQKKDFLTPVFNKVREIAEKAYWDNLEEKILSSDFSVLIECLKEIKDRLKTIVSFSLLPDKDVISNEIDDRIDTDFIVHLLNGNVYTPENLTNLVNYILFIIEEVGSRKEATRSLKEFLISEINKIEEWNLQQWASILVKIISSLYKRLECFVKIE